ncbi:diphthamide biosynthesis protein 2-related domain containing protein [Theileria equi strain WA]|uniref:2-(3-amino-3-carboxypropyl)histidine synthase subunit 1 n=1 Tax=Theileria equi strain WA TaxID=1537102 RepID=L0AW48_THEEQ|nr:diphthamide biosynthesis protein 2-related domain containing protein [Theileria equi strain WA]AFZ79256.1 diphthamide biosynthesis protein 2-related domain containing protein [Theileria equi strain WA]|eukprot:XP_004828922.1 diphthamide biosynthesis protein 2-related domain containing protein [Theileria equi strain WA]
MDTDSLNNSLPNTGIRPVDSEIGRLAEYDEDFLSKVIAKALPSNYNFEVRKCIAKIRQKEASCVALQMPEGLLHWGCEISDILLFFCPSLTEVVIMADVTYGACCIDDLTAACLGCDLVIHYGHSCLIPINTVTLDCLYVFVEISFPADKLVDSIKTNFDENDHLIMLGTIQYSNVLRETAAKLDADDYFKYQVDIPQALPLLPGEVLGCTSPKIDVGKIRRKIANGSVEAENDALAVPNATDKIIFIADGRFHLESTLIQNPGIQLFRFDPFSKIFSEESYDLECLQNTRHDAIINARRSRKICIILSTLGRQGNTNIFKNISDLLTENKIDHFKLMLSEITLEKLESIDADAFIQVGCPRLSIDWGTSFKKPILNPYESYVAFGKVEYKRVYPMDYYSRAGGDWANYPANAKATDAVDPKEMIRQRLMQRSMNAKRVEYSS